METAFDNLGGSLGKFDIVARNVPSRIDLLMLDDKPKPLALTAPPPTQPAQVGPDARAYNELLDEFSSHLIYIRKGKLMFETPEFQSYQRILEFKWHWI